jgi:hypothetical protein
MPTELTNLLPEFRKRSFRRQYFVRLGTMFVAVLACLILLHGVLLLPTYLYAREEVARNTATLAALNASADTAGEAALIARKGTLNSTASNLSRLKDAPAASTAVRAILATPRPGVSLTGFTFTAPTSQNTPARKQLTGTAASRDTLRQYVAALGTLPFVTKADLPISAYAQETDIDFTITLTMTPVSTLLP